MLLAGAAIVSRNRREEPITPRFVPVNKLAPIRTGMLALAVNCCSRAVKFTTRGPVGEVVALGTIKRADIVVDAALVSVSTVLRTMNWLAYTSRVRPVAELDTLPRITSCVALPNTVAVSTRAKERPAAFVIGAYAVIVVGPLPAKAALIVSLVTLSAFCTSVATNPALVLSTRAKSAKPFVRVTSEYTYVRPPMTNSETLAAAGTPLVYVVVAHGRHENAGTPLSMLRVGASTHAPTLPELVVHVVP